PPGEPAPRAPASSSPGAIPNASSKQRARSTRSAPRPSTPTIRPPSSRSSRDLPTPIDHVMVTAGAPHYGPPLEMPPEEARRGLTEHLLLALEVARGAVDKVGPPGSLVFMGGTGARRPRAGLGNRLDSHRRVPHPHRQPRARARADPRQSDRRRLRR